MSVVPGLPEPPTTHPASPQRARGDCTECSGTGRSPQRGHSGSPHAHYYSQTGSPGRMYSGSPGAYGGGYGATGSPHYGGGEYERMMEQQRHEAVASHISGGLGGIPGYRSPGREYAATSTYNVQTYSPGHMPATPVYMPPVHSSSPPGGLAASPGTPNPPRPGERLTGEGESPRRIRAWGAPHTVHGAP